MSDAASDDAPLEPMAISPLSVLYHPYFEPDLTTLRRALLFNEAVRSIVPKQAPFEPSPSLFKHLQALPGTFVPTSPEEDDLNIVKEYHVLGILRKAFAQISTDEQAKKLQAIYSRRGGIDELGLDIEDELSIGGFTLLNSFKLTYAIYQMLEEYHLIFEKRDDGNFLVDERAAHLIVTFLAQRMSYRLAVRTLTEVDSSYLLSTACDIYDAFEPDKEAYFGSAVLKIHVPEEIGQLDGAQYVELRERYSDLRQSFPAYLQELQQLYRIKDVKTAREMSARLGDIQVKFNTDIERIKQSRLGLSVRRWLPLGIGGALSLGAAIFTPQAVPLTIGMVGIQLLNGLGSAPMMGHFDGVRSMLLDVRTDVQRPDSLPHLLGEGFLKYTRPD